MAIALALMASAAYGFSDAAASVVTRRTSALAVAWWAHVLAGLVIAPLAVIIAGAPPAGGLGLGTLAGAVSGMGALLLYSALGRGEVSVVTPIVASAVVVPVLVGVAIGQGPGRLGLIGLVLAAGGVLVIARTSSPQGEPGVPGRAPQGVPGGDQGARPSRLPPVAAALLAAGAFGIAFVMVDAAAAAGAEGSPLWVAAGLQLGGLGALTVVVVAGSRARVAVPRGAAGLLVATALLFAAGDVALAFALSLGDLAVVSVLASLDTVVSVLLARMVLREHLGVPRTLGVAAAVLGAAVLAAGA